MKKQFLDHFTGVNAKGKNQGKDQLQYDVYYDRQTFFHVLGARPNKSQTILVGFHDQTNKQTSFSNQFAQLREFADHVQRPALFFAKEPGNNSHFMAGIYFDNNLIVFNPIGITQHKDFYKALQRIRKKHNDLNIFVNKTTVQAEKKLVSCGPICLELLLHLHTAQRWDQLDAILDQIIKTAEQKQKHRFKFDAVDFTEALPDSLKNIVDKDLSQDNTDAVAIRQSHYEILGRAKQESFTNDLFDGNTVAQVIFNKMVLGNEAIFQQVMEDEDLPGQLKTILNDPTLIEDSEEDTMSSDEDGKKKEDKKDKPADDNSKPDESNDKTKTDHTKQIEEYQKKIKQLNSSLLQWFMRYGLNNAEKENKLDNFEERGNNIIQKWCNFLLAMRIISTILTVFISAGIFALAGVVTGGNKNIFNVKTLADNYKKTFKEGVSATSTADVKPVPPLK